MNNKIKCMCTTIKTIQMVGTDLHIEFLDGSVREYKNGQEHYDRLIHDRSHTLKGVGPYYRSEMRDKGVAYKEIRAPYIDHKFADKYIP